MPWNRLPTQGPWDQERPAQPTLLVVVYNWRWTDNLDIAYRDTVHYPTVGQTILYQPDDASDQDDFGWWKVRLFDPRPQNAAMARAVWVHPGVLARITGHLSVAGVGTDPSVYPGEFDCRGIGSHCKPTQEEIDHCGWCAPCQTRLATADDNGKERYRRHLLQLLQVFQNTESAEVVTVICKGGRHRSLSLAVLVWHLTHVHNSSSDKGQVCRHRPPCPRLDADGALAILRLLM